MPHNPDLRLAAVEEFNRAWGEALVAGAELRRSYEHLAKCMRDMAEHGSRQTLKMPDELEQEWWVTFQEKLGNLIPREPIMPPIPELERT